MKYLRRLQWWFYRRWQLLRQWWIAWRAPVALCELCGESGCLARVTWGSQSSGTLQTAAICSVCRGQLQQRVIPLLQSLVIEDYVFHISEESGD